jgi:hypothetical protein
MGDAIGGIAVPMTMGKTMASIESLLNGRVDTRPASACAVSHNASPTPDQLGGGHDSIVPARAIFSKTRRARHRHTAIDVAGSSGKDRDGMHIPPFDSEGAQAFRNRCYQVDSTVTGLDVKCQSNLRHHETAPLIGVLGRQSASELE